MALLDLSSKAPRGGVMTIIKVRVVSDLMIRWRCPYQTTRFCAYDVLFQGRSCRKICTDEQVVEVIYNYRVCVHPRLFRVFRVSPPSFLYLHTTLCLQYALLWLQSLPTASVVVSLHHIKEARLLDALLRANHNARSGLNKAYLIPLFRPQSLPTRHSRMLPCYRQSPMFSLLFHLLRSDLPKWRVTARSDEGLSIVQR